MSELDEANRPACIAGRADSSRAAILGDAEYAGLIAALDSAVLPILRNAAALLESSGFSVVRVERRGGMASLMVQHTDVDAWIRFQIHHSFGLLLSSERIFWMTTVFKDGDMVSGKPGRLQDLDDVPAIASIVSDFTIDCIRVG